MFFSDGTLKSWRHFGYTCWALLQWDIYFRALANDIDACRFGRTSKMYECSLFKWRAPRSMCYVLGWDKAECVMKERKWWPFSSTDGGLFPILWNMYRECAIIDSNWLPFASIWVHPPFLLSFVFLVLSIRGCPFWHLFITVHSASPTI